MIIVTWHYILQQTHVIVHQEKQPASPYECCPHVGISRFALGYIIVHCVYAISPKFNPEWD